MGYYPTEGESQLFEVFGYRGGEIVIGDLEVYRNKMPLGNVPVTDGEGNNRDVRKILLRPYDINGAPSSI